MTDYVPLLSPEKKTHEATPASGLEQYLGKCIDFFWLTDV